MDVATLLGIVSGFGLVIMAIQMGGGLIWFVNVPSMMIVLGGALAITRINYPLSDVLGVMKVLKNAFLFKISQLTAMLPKIVDLSRVARRD
ncbi:MAG: motility protein A, partial [Deltaproteobacteria bacterium]|nr:motility protein A [Deltaproteobacteria bacterium]